MNDKCNDYLSWKIAEYLGVCVHYYENGKGLHNVVDWLMLCANLESVNIEPSKYDEGLLYCGSAWDYEQSKSDVLSKINKELVRFHFAWGALESMVSSFVPEEKIEQHGKINALCGFLTSSNVKEFVPNSFISLFNRLIELLRIIPQYSEELASVNMSVETKYHYRQHVDISGIGIYVVYKIRNRFAHGAMQFPEPEEHGGEEIRDIDLISAATRITLFTILILIINDIKNDDYYIDDNLFFDVQEQSALQYLLGLF